MKKTLLALAVAGACAVPAYADVTLSGAINMGPVWGRVSDGSGSGNSNSIRSGSTAKGFSGTGLTSNYSNINITSNDDIGGGNKLVFNYSLDVSNSGSTVHDTAGAARSRNTNMGIMGGWGGVYMGINEHLYEQYQYKSDVLDGAVGIGGNLQMLGTTGGGVFDNGNSGCTASSGCQEFYRRQGHALWFDSANYGGVTFGVALSLNAYKSSASDTNTPRFWSAGVQYKPDGGPFYIDAAIERHTNFYGVQAITGGSSAGTSSKDTGVQIGGGVMFGDLSLNLRFERLSYETDAGLSAGVVNKYERDAIWAGLKLGMATGYAGLQIGLASDGDCERVGGAGCSASDTGALMIAGGYFHNLSKQTQLQVLGSYTNNDSLGNYINIGSPSSGTGVDGLSFGLGIKHVF
jgi:Gram-negative porin